MMEHAGMTERDRNEVLVAAAVGITLRDWGGARRTMQRMRACGYESMAIKCVRLDAERWLGPETFTKMFV
jgi:hypothetical protein